jgi:hypothetical protein
MGGTGKRRCTSGRSDKKHKTQEVDMFKKLMRFSFVLVAMLFTSNCGPTATPTPPVKQPAALDLYREADKCPIAPESPKGEITYDSWMPGAFSGTLKITGLDKNKTYVFTINGQEGFSGNQELISSCKESAGYAEGFCNMDAPSNEDGTIERLITRKLNPGEYEPKFFIKDKDQGYCVLMYNNTPLPFEIKK